MPKNPELEQIPITINEAGRFLLGALARTSLKIAILEAEDVRKRINPQRKKRLKEHFAISDHFIHVREAYEIFRLTWKREKETTLPNLGDLGRKTIGTRERLVNQRIVVPLYKICTHIGGQKPDPSQPWTGELLINAVLEKEGTEEVYSFLAKFGLDPKTMVEEVYQSLDRKLKRR